MAVKAQPSKPDPRSRSFIWRFGRLANAGILMIGWLTWSTATAASTDFQACVLDQVSNGDPNQTAIEIKQKCSPTDSQQTAGRSVPATSPTPESSTTESALQYRWRAEHDVENRDYAVSLYRPNYIMFTHDSKFDAADSIYAPIDPDFENLKKEEIKYQVSVKFPVWRNMFNTNTDLNFAYTQASWWQLFSDEGITSAPFRETNYEPELFLRHYMQQSLPFGGQLSALDLALVHQSNGQTERLSRSWNRVIGRAVLDYGDLGVLLRLWYRIPEDKEDDDNPDTEDYYGYGDIRASWAPNKNTFGIMWRPGLKKSGLELSWSYPITNRLRIYTQWWHGYGESMIDYDRKVNRFGIGLAINDWLEHHD